MPSMLSMIPAALSLAATVLALPQDPTSGTVGAGAAGNTYPNCPDPDETCVSYGVDFHNDGIYFQNSALTDPFTFATVFDGCQKGASAYNVLVDPSGTEYNCTSTSLTPDNTTVTSTCSIDKNQLSSGDWSILLYSNNGDCAPFNAKREFILSVGPQATTTVTPLVVFTSTSTPISSNIVTSTTTTMYYAPTPTVTSSKSVKNPTRTITPIKSTVLSTTTLKVKYVTSYDLLVSNKIVTRTAKCTVSEAPVADQSATVTPSGAPAATTDSTDSTADNKRRSFNMDSYVQERAANLNHAIAKRAPDVATVVSVITDPASFSTSLVIMTAPAVTFQSTTLIETSSTSTPMAVTLYANAQVVTTLPQVTVTKVRTLQQDIEYTSATKYATATITTTVTPSAASKKCAASGGVMQ